MWKVSRIYVFASVESNVLSVIASKCANIKLLEANFFEDFAELVKICKKIIEFRTGSVWVLILVIKMI